MSFNPADLNVFDWLLLIVLALSIVRAAMRGLVQALFGLLGFVGGFELASWNYVGTGDWMYRNGWFKNVPTARAVAFLVVAVMVVIVFDLVGRGVKRSAHAIGFGMLDRIGGACFGLARGLLLGVAVIVAVQAIDPQAEWLRYSRLRNYFLGVAQSVSFAVPHEFH